MFRRLVLGLAATVSLGTMTACAGAAPGSHPDDMSAEEHREDAAAHNKIADEHEAKYDPKAVRVRTVGGHPGPTVGEVDIYIDQYFNPTAKHRILAAKHREYARQHEQAAEALAAFEAAECREIPTNVRSFCPLLGRVEHVEDIEGGARLRLEEEIPLSVAVQHMKCHFAYGRTVGREGMPGCPLYLEGIRIDASGEHSVDITSEDPVIVEKIRARSRAHMEDWPQ